MHYERFRRHGDPLIPGLRLGSEHKSTAMAIRRPSGKMLAWAAGFLGGEGNFRDNATTTVITASQVNREPVQRLLEMFGGSLRFTRNKQWSPTWVWAACGMRARGIAMTLYVFMSAKRQTQIRRALS